MSLTDELGVSAGIDHFGHCSSGFPPSRILIQNHSLAYRGALEVVCVPKGSEWSLTLSDVPNPRAPTRIGPGGPHVFNQADGSWGGHKPGQDTPAAGLALRTVQFGWPLGMPLCRPVGGGLHELRVSLKGKQEARLLFCVHDETIVGLHAFFKTTRKTPKGELKLAKQRMRAMQ